MLVKNNLLHVVFSTPCSVSRNIVNFTVFRVWSITLTKTEAKSCENLRISWEKSRGYDSEENMILRVERLWINAQYSKMSLLNRIKFFHSLNGKTSQNPTYSTLVLFSMLITFLQKALCRIGFHWLQPDSKIAATPSKSCEYLNKSTNVHKKTFRLTSPGKK